MLHAAIAEGAAAVGAHRGVVAELLPDGESLRLEVGKALSPSLEGTWRRFQLSARSPVSEAVRTGEPVFVESREGLAAAYPEVALPAALLDMAAFAVLPLEVRGRRFGALGFTFAAPRRFEANERALLAALAQQCAQALDRARLYEEADAARTAAETEGRRAEEANRAKTQFLSTMSHELRTPLNAIGGHAQLLEMGLHGPVTEGQLDALSRIVRAQQHLLGLINDILNLARIEAGRVEYDMASVSLAPIVTDVARMVEPQLAAKQLILRVHAADDRPRVAWADGDRLRQILLNLLSNAAKFTPAGGTVEVRLVDFVPFGAAEPPGVGIEVRDTGVGIAEDQRGRIFEPFVQLHRHLSAESQQGTGLGLAISRDLARGMGGDLTFAPVAEGGSAFTISLRRAAPAAAALPTAPRAAALPSP